MEPYSPFLTWRFDTALQFASGLHHQQPRKGTHIPYIAHLMSVSALVIEAGGVEDQAIAALLHDAVEDQGGLPTLVYDPPPFREAGSQYRQILLG